MRDHTWQSRSRHSCIAALAAAVALACGACGSAEDPAPGAPSAASSGGAGDAPGSPAGGPGAPPAATCAVAPASGELVVATTRGLVQGRKAGNVSAFLGIPFASPPTGALRFAPPEPAACWTSVKPATAFGASCPQAKLTGLGAEQVQGEEDCLTINVWTPSVAPATKAHVLMFMHGGANMAGSSNQVAIPGNVVGASETDSATRSVYDGQALADAQKAVVVTFNYRLGALGFLAHPSLSASSPKGASGNYGLEDAILALHWVQDNIGSFGGDRTRVMFFGESAGAFNTCALLASPLAAGLFSTALMESGSCGVPLMKERYVKGQDVSAALHCETATDVAACLRAAPFADVIAASRSTSDPTGLRGGPVDVPHISDMIFGSSVDGYVLPDTPLHTIAAGKGNAAAVVVGANADEMRYFLLPGTINTCLDYTLKVRDGFGANADALLAMYPCSLLAPSDAWVKLMSDLVFACPSRRALRALSKAGKAPVYRYRFDHTFTYGALAAYGAFHSAEIPFVFGSFAGFGYVPTSAETALSGAIQGYWAKFARTGNPNGPGQTLWETYDASRDNALILDEAMGVQDGISAKECDFWDTLDKP